MKSIRKLLLISLFPIQLMAQNTHSVLEAYIDEALASNITLQQQELSVAKSLEVLREARAIFIPHLSFTTSYTTSEGQSILGTNGSDDDINGLIQNLNLINNTLENTQPGYPDISTYENIEMGNTLNNRQQTYLRLSMPVLNTSIWYNHQLQKELVMIEKISLEAYKNELTNDVKIAYYQYIQTEKLIGLQQKTLQLALENQRSSQKLYEHDKITKDVVLLSQADVAQAKQEIAEAEKNQQLAKTYFNFLLNRNYFDAITAPDSTDFTLLQLPSIDECLTTAIDNRGEMQQANHKIMANEKQIGLQKGNYLPQANLALDYGIRGTEYQLTEEDDYLQFGASLSWNLFSGFENKSKVQQAKIDLEYTQTEKLKLVQSIEHEVIDAYYDLIATQKSIELAREEKVAASEAYEFIQQKFQHGMATYYETSEALLRYTQAAEKEILTAYQLLEKKAQLEKAIQHEL